MKGLKKLLVMLLVCALSIPSIPTLASEGDKTVVSEKSVSENQLKEVESEEAEDGESGSVETKDGETGSAETEDGTVGSSEIEGGESGSTETEDGTAGSAETEGEATGSDETKNEEAGSEVIEGEKAESEETEGGEAGSDKTESEVAGNDEIEGTESGNNKTKIEETENDQQNSDVSGNTVSANSMEKQIERGPILRSIRPIKKDTINVDLTKLSPLELSMVSFDQIFTGDKALKDTDYVMWRVTSSDYVSDYTISSSKDRINLINSNSYEMLVGEKDQLATNNIRYTVNINKTYTNDWLTSTVYKEGNDGIRASIQVLDRSFYSNSYANIYVLSEEIKDIRQAYVSLGFNTDKFPGLKDKSIRIFEGQFNSPEEAEKGNEITSQLLAKDMTQKGAGYLVSVYNTKWITMVMYDENGIAVGWLPFRMNLYLEGKSSNSNTGNYINISSSDLYHTSLSYENQVAWTYKGNTDSAGIKNYTLELYNEYESNGQYLLKIDYYQYDQQGGYYTSKNNAVTAAYVGNFTSIAEAKGNTDIKEDLFTNGYKADYSKGVIFTVFVGEDGNDNQEVHKFSVTTTKGTQAKYTLDSSADVTFQGFYDKDGNFIESAQIGVKEDSYGSYNYITVLTKKDIDLSNLAPSFYTRSTVKLYAPGSSAPLESGKTYFDFSKGAVEFSTASEDGIYSKNYWVQVVNPSDAVNNIYINSFKDEKANTKVENGIIYSNREVIMDSYHNSIHDIIVANMGTTSIPNLKVELVSDALLLDSYWTLYGNYELAPITQIRTYGNEQENLAKIRLKAKEGISGNISGTLTIKSGETTLVVLKLTGIVGSPVIVTEEIPQAVKYVPYGTILQNNNSYTWNQISYSLQGGNLPAGMEIKPNGEIYGVPTESGEFTFEVKMDNGDSAFVDDIQSFTMTILENTDTNVENATDTGYELSQRVQSVDGSSSGTQLLESQGEFTTFVDIYLDGNKLEKGVDYEAEEGSTRITIRNQTLQNTARGTHTLGIEFREGTEQVLKRAAQNFDNNDPKAPEPEEENGSQGGNNSQGGNTSNNNTGNGSISTTGSGATSNNIQGGNTSTTTVQSSGGSTALRNPIAVKANTLIEWTTVESLLSQNKAKSSVDISTGMTNIDIAVEGTFQVASNVLLNLMGQKETVAFHGKDGIALSLSGQNINAISVLSFKNMNLGIKSNTNTIPANIVSEKTNNSLKQLQFTIEENVVFPVVVNLHIGVGKQLQGKTAYLYYYEQDGQKLDYCGSYVVNEDGQVMYGLGKGGTYLLVVGNGSEDITQIMAEKRYMVQLGDTLYRIARRNNLSLEDLLRKNPQILNPNLIIPGQVINL